MEWNKIKITFTYKNIVIALLIAAVLVFINQQLENPKTDKDSGSIESDISEKNKTEIVEIVEPIIENIPVEQETITEKEITIEEEIIETLVETANFQSVIAQCNSLCGTDSDTYCTTQNEVIF